MFPMVARPPEGSPQISPYRHDKDVDGHQWAFAEQLRDVAMEDIVGNG